MVTRLCRSISQPIIVIVLPHQFFFFFFFKCRLSNVNIAYSSHKRTIIVLNSNSLYTCKRHLTRFWQREEVTLCGKQILSSLPLFVTHTPQEAVTQCLSSSSQWYGVSAQQQSPVFNGQSSLSPSVTSVSILEKNKTSIPLRQPADSNTTPLSIRSGEVFLTSTQTHFNPYINPTKCEIQLLYESPSL